MNREVEAWYRHRWPWIIITLLACSVSLSLAMVTIAVKHPDTLVSDNYYEAGKGINRSLDRELLAQALQLRAEVRLDELTGEVDVRLSGDSQPSGLTLNLISPTQPGKDRQVQLKRSASEPGRYVGQLDDSVQGRRFVELLGEHEGNTWRLFEEEQVGAERALQLGDEPLQAAEEHRQ